MPREFPSLRRFLKLLRGSNARDRVLSQMRGPLRLWVRQGGAVDAALGGVGFALAGLSLLFACEMIGTPRKAYIPGMQYLAIFAQPNSSAPDPARRSSPPAYAQSVTATGVDYAPTASIPNGRQQQAEDKPAEEPMGYEILSATKDAAWLRRGSQINEVHKGDRVPGLGKIVSIEQLKGRWRLLLESGESELPEKPRRGPGTKPFARPLIFDGPTSEHRRSAL